MNASYSVYDAGDGQYYAANGLLYDSYDGAYYANVAMGMIDDFNTPATTYLDGTEAQPTTVQKVINDASAPKAQSSNLGDIISGMFNSTMTTAGNALNTRLQADTTLAQAKINAQIAAINAPKAATPAPAASASLLSGGGMLILGAAAVLGVVLVSRR